MRLLRPTTSSWFRSSSPPPTCLLHAGQCAPARTVHATNAAVAPVVRWARPHGVENAPAPRATPAMTLPRGQAAGTACLPYGRWACPAACRSSRACAPSQPCSSLLRLQLAHQPPARPRWQPLGPIAHRVPSPGTPGACAPVTALLRVHGWPPLPSLQLVCEAQHPRKLDWCKGPEPGGRPRRLRKLCIDRQSRRASGPRPSQHQRRAARRNTTPLLSTHVAQGARRQAITQSDGRSPPVPRPGRCSEGAARRPSSRRRGQSWHARARHRASAASAATRWPLGRP